MDAMDAMDAVDAMNNVDGWMVLYAIPDQKSGKAIPSSSRI